MSDISLLFDVEGGSSVGDGSGKLILDQLTGIVNTINSNPLKIKFQADPESLDSVRKQIQKITESLGASHIVVGDSAKSSNVATVKPIDSSMLDTYRTKIQNLILTLEKLKISAQDSTANVLIDNETVNVSDVINNAVTSLQYYKDNTLSANTAQKDFNNNLSAYNTIIKSIQLALANEATLKARIKKEDKESAKDAEALSKALLTNTKLYTQANNAVQKYTAAKQGKSKNEYAVLERESNALLTLNDRFKSGAITQQEYINESNRLKTVIQQSIATIKANGEAHLSLSDKIKLTVSRLTQLVSTARILTILRQAIRRMVQESIALDSAFTQLKIVTGATDSEMEKFSETAIDLSKNLGKSIADITKSIETFSRLGYSLPDASVLAEYATILANTAGVSTEEATTGLTSVIKGFGLSVSDTEHVTDILIDIGQKYAVSASELMTAFEKSGAALSATNTSIEKSAGLIAAANASVQNASTVGTALKTVSARIRGSKTDLESLGEDTEELADGFSKYAEEIKALTGFDIMVDDSTHEFKDLYDIMQGISEVWDKLTDTQQSRVSEILGGTRQLQVISSILGNWKDATGAYNSATNSAGVATRANDIYMSSAEAHINQLKASFEELSSDVASSKLIIFFADFANTVVSAMDKFSKFPLPAITGAISALLSLKGVGERMNQFQFRIILRIEYAHEAFN